MNELSAQYDPKSIEAKWYAAWENAGAFTAPQKPTAKGSYCIVIPPPNVTGVLHMGHALNNTLQDILTRWKRMQGYATLWQPGTDHAGIATQNVVEKEVWKTEKKRRQEIGREALVERIWKWKHEYGDRILNQLKALGSSCDWSRTRFTLDEGLNKAVRECFVKLYQEKLIYRGKYIVNWCPRCHTALADDEVEHEESKGQIWHIRYPRAHGKGHITVATTRPETLLGDVAVAVNPKDERYASLIGQSVKLPETNREIPIIADDYVDASFGSGAVKITPAHDPNDFQVGLRHNLPQINVMNADASMNDEAGKNYAGLSREDCRKKLLVALEAQGLLEKVEEHSNSVGHCYRCDTRIEPWLSDQWFVKMRPLAELAMKASKDKKVTFHPERWESFYLSWLENVRDWCISRQIWWGHRIPVWYKKGEDRTNPENWHVSVAGPTDAQNWEQDDDVLDTWFSSALWPFSTLGWPEKTEELKTYYPTSTLSTDRGIIYFWVARMVMMGMKLMNDVPFRDVYIHGTILDEQGRKMSKSLGNGIDPLDLIEKYGADAVRFSLVLLTTEGQDLKLSESKFEMGRNFCNKLWNASRFVMMNSQDLPGNAFPTEQLSAADAWILSRLAECKKTALNALDHFQFMHAGQSLYQFAWNDFCDWYLEAAKLTLNSSNAAEKSATQQTLRYVLSELLKLLHPFMPFVTEEIWASLGNQQMLISTEYPDCDQKVSTEQALQFSKFVQEPVENFRKIRGESQVQPGKKLPQSFAIYANSADVAAAQKLVAYVQHLAKTEQHQALTKAQKPESCAKAAVAAGEFAEYFVPLAGLIDVTAERARLQKEIVRAEALANSVQNKLSNEQFVSNAPAAVIEKEKAKLAEAEKLKTSSQEALERLASL